MLGVLLSSAMYRSQLCCPSCHASVLNIIFRYASQTHYQVLGIKKNASQSEIRSAFLDKSKKLHPDINVQDSKSHDKFVKVNEAYSILSKPLQRREYDMNLAVRLHMEKQAREASSSHTHGSSAWPGANYNQQYEDRHEQFWDESLHMHNKSREKEFDGWPYIPKLPKSYIVYGCIAFITFGIFVHYLVFSYSRNVRRKILDARDRRISKNLENARTAASVNGNTLQLQILHARVRKKPLPEGVDATTLRKVVNE